MRKCSKKLLAILMAAAMTCGLAACGGSDGGKESSSAPAEESKAEESSDAGEESDSGAASAYGRISEEEITLKLVGPQPSGLEDWKNLAVVEEYASRLGIRLDCEFYQTDWATQRTLVIADDRVPDLIWDVGGIGDVNKWGADGYFLNLKDYIDLMPNMQKTFEEFPDLEAFVTASDGSIYGLAGVRVDLTDRLSGRL